MNKRGKTRTWERRGGRLGNGHKCTFGGAFSGGEKGNCGQGKGALM